MRFLAILLSTCGLLACANNPPIIKHVVIKEKITPVTTQQQLIATLADLLNEHDSLTDLDEQMISSSFVWVDSYSTQTNNSLANHLGLSLEEQLVTELIRQQVKISEYKTRQAISLQKTGGYYLTRDKNLTSDKVHARYVLSGTMANFQDFVQLNAKVIDFQNGNIVASAGIKLPHSAVFNSAVNAFNGTIYRQEN